MSQLSLAVLGLALLCCPIMAGPIIPLGSGAGAVQFDSIIELDPPLSHSQILLFVRYWVTQEHYRLAVVWSEPQTPALPFPGYPPTFSVYSDEMEFRLTHSLFPRLTTNFTKPFGGPGAFTFKYGDYAFSNLRYADREANLWRVPVADVGNLSALQKTPDESTLIPLTPLSGSTDRPFASLKIKSREEIINSMEMLGKDSQLLKRVQYEYGGAQTNVLLRERVFIAERALMLGFQKTGPLVTLNGKKYQVNEIPGSQQPGGRDCTVDFDSVQLGEKSSLVPTRIEVRGARSNNLLQSASSTNFRRAGSSAADSAEGAANFAGFSAAERRYWDIMQKNWGVAPERVSISDKAAINEIIREFGRNPERNPDTVGERLKRFNILMTSGRIIGDEETMKRNFREYLGILADNGLAQMILDGGYNFIEQTRRGGREHELDAVSGIWLEKVSSALDGDRNLRFAAKILQRGDYWVALQLLEETADALYPAPGQQFERMAMKCVALDKLRDLLRKRKAASASLADPDAGINLPGVKIGLKEVEQELPKVLGGAQKILKNLVELTPIQKGLRSELNKIAG